MTRDYAPTRFASLTGELNHQATFPDSVVRKARLWHERGYTPAEVRAHLHDMGHDVDAGTVENWLYFRTRTTA